MIFSTQTQPCKKRYWWKIHKSKSEILRKHGIIRGYFPVQPKTLDTPWYATKYRFPLLPLLIDGATQKETLFKFIYILHKMLKNFKYLHNSKNCSRGSAMVFSHKFHSSREILKNVFFCFFFWYTNNKLPKFQTQRFWNMKKKYFKILLDVYAVSAQRETVICQTVKVIFLVNLCWK